MKEELSAALENIAKDNAQAVVAAAEKIKQLPRTAEGLFDTTSVDADCFEAARWVYPVYAYYETECNKKEGYPDLLRQMESLQAKQESAKSLEKTALFLDALIHTIDNVTPQLYEYYIELVQMFKATVKKTIADYYQENHFTDGSDKAEAADKLIRKAITRAGESYVLLGEKYRQYMETV